MEIRGINMKKDNLKRLGMLSLVVMMISSFFSGLVLNVVNPSSIRFLLIPASTIIDAFLLLTKMQFPLLPLEMDDKFILFSYFKNP